jgi:hypothetical protein
MLRRPIIAMVPLVPAVVAAFAAAGMLPLDATTSDEPAKTPAKVGVNSEAPAVSDAVYRDTVQPFFEEYCLRCHQRDKPKGEFRLDRGFRDDFNDPVSVDKWKEIRNVLASHDMPPKKAKQPKDEEVSKVVDWATAKLIERELATRGRKVTLRRLNREEYRNTIRELTGIDVDVSGFPQDPPAGGFDNNGKALTVSPLHIEIYLHAARWIMERALVEGKRPETIRWRFDPKTTPMDQRRVRYGEHNPIVNGGANREEGDWVIVHHESWDRGVNARDFRVPVEGDYLIRIRAAGIIPGRDKVIAGAKTLIEKGHADQLAKDPKARERLERELQQQLVHFQTDRSYDYGPPRIKLQRQLGPLPKTIAEFDADGTLEQPKIHEFKTRMTTESAGIMLDYAYSIPSVLENFWMQGKPEFARPELAVDWFEIEGPVYDAWPPRGHSVIVGDKPLPKTKGEESARAREILTRFLRRAFRRPVTRDEVEAKLALFEKARAQEPTFLAALRLPLAATLISPNFLYLTEPAGDDPATPEPAPLSQHEFASRLSYFLWSTMPDERLMKLADEGSLRKRAKVQAEIDRMLADPRAENLVRNFAGQWLGLREVGANPPAPDLYPEYDRHLELSIVAESQAFFREILRQNLPVTAFLKSDFVTVNERLARFYGIEGVRGDAFRKVPVPEAVRRGGIVTQASVLTITSNGTRTSPVKRGTWIMKNLLNMDPGLPVANAGEIAPKVPGIDKATVRKRLEIHRELEQCARCHHRIDPLGFALENYNAAGQWREREGFGYKGRIEPNDPLIDASSVMPDGRKLGGVTDLQDAMVARQDQFLDCLASKLFTYALGRELILADRAALDRAIAGMKKDGLTLKALIREIVTSEPFSLK